MTPPRSLLTDREALVLRQLRASSQYGIQLVNASDGLLSRKSVYVLLHRMVDKGLIVSRVVDTPPGELGPPRRIYSSSEYGTDILRVHEDSAIAVANLRSRHARRRCAREDE